MASSRIEKYYSTEKNQTSTSLPTRSSRFSRLYKEVYGKYDNLDNLPIEDNTDEIDMEKLKELVLNNTPKKEQKEYSENLNVLEQKRRKIDDQKIYDINKILEKAKYENHKLKEPDSTPISKVNKKLLSTLESTEISTEEIQKAKENYEPKQYNIETEEQLSMTRELKYQNLSKKIEEDPLINQAMPTNDLSLDLFSDLKPTENTITTKPIRENINMPTEKKEDIRSKDTSDIDIIKTKPQNNMDNDFFTSSYEFSKKDFADDDFYDTKKRSGIFKILLLFLAIMIFIGVIIYFISTYGLGV